MRPRRGSGRCARPSPRGPQRPRRHSRPGAAEPRSAATTAHPGWLSRAQGLLTCRGRRPSALVLRLVELDFPVDLVLVFAVVGNSRLYQPGRDLQILSRLGHGPVVVPDGGDNLPDIQAAAEQAGTAAARAVEELDEWMCVVT